MFSKLLDITNVKCYRYKKKEYIVKSYPKLLIIREIIVVRKIKKDKN